MYCSTCGHTLHRPGFAPPSDTIWLCPRCGTLTNGIGETYVPLLVERCNRLAAELQGGNFPAGGQEVLECLHRLGILESIALPENRVKVI
jgi:hypothetical protein